MARPGRNTIVLSILFFGPLLFYIFLLTGTNNFARLPVLTNGVDDVTRFQPEADGQQISLDGNISILCFLGRNPLDHKTNALNLNEKIYKHFFGFKGFQFVVVLPDGSQEYAAQLKKELGATYDVDQWHFLFGSDQQVLAMFESLKTSYSLDGNISILCFLGRNPLDHKTNALNLNEKIYKHFFGFKGFQFVVVLPDGSQEYAAQLKKELGATYDVDQWHFLFGSDQQVLAMFESLKTSYSLDASLYSPDAFIIDREMNLRGRNDDDDMPDGMRYGYNAESISTVHQEMVDDVKVVVAEDRLALKKNKRQI